MIGLEFICSTFDISYSELARKLETTPQNINSWLKFGSKGGRKISKERLDQLDVIFPNIPKEYFQKELTKSEQIEIQIIHLTETDEFEEVDFVITDDDDGKEYITTQTYSQHQGIIQILHNEQERESLIERYKNLINEESGSGYGNRKMIEKYLKLLETNDKRHMEFLQMAFYYLKNEKEWGFDPFFAASNKQIEMYEEFSIFLKKYNILDN